MLDDIKEDFSGVLSIVSGIEDEEIWDIIVKECKCPDAFEFAGEKLKTDREYILELAQDEDFVWAYQYISDELKADKELLLEFMKSDPAILYYADDNLRSNKELILMAMQSDKFGNKDETGLYSLDCPLDYECNLELYKDKEFVNQVVELMKQNQWDDEYVRGVEEFSKNIKGSKEEKIETVKDLMKLNKEQEKEIKELQEQVKGKGRNIDDE